MEIFVNNDILDFQLENEQTLKDVIEGLNDWLFKNMKVIENIVIDGKVHTGEIQELVNYPVEDVDRLELTVININDLVSNSLTETKNYLKEIHKYLDSKEDFTEEDIKRILSGLHWLINIFTRTNNIYNYEKVFSSAEFNYINELSSLVSLRDEIEHSYTEKEYNHAAEIIKTGLLASVNNWFNNIDKLLSYKPASTNTMDTMREKVSGQVYNIIRKIPEMQKLIEMTAMDIQTGHENEAMANIQIIIGTIESIIALLQLIKSTFSLDFNLIKYNNDSIEEFNKKLIYLLQELLESMKIKDTVLMSDLLTYELTHKIEQYGEILKLIAREIDIEIN